MEPPSGSIDRKRVARSASIKGIVHPADSSWMDYALGVRFVERALDPFAQRLHVATPLARAILQQPLGAAEGVVHGELRIEEAIVGLGRVVDVEIDPARQGHVDMDGKGAIQAVGYLDGDVAGRHAAIDM